MKTLTYLRLSLLIPLVVWLFTVLISVGMEALSLTYDYFNEETPTAISAMLTLVGSYAFGIILWIFPYILLALILFFWSFLAQPRTALRVFALSPVAMTILTIAVTILFLLGISGGVWGYPVPFPIDANFVGIHIYIGVMAFTWGYLCVGIGYGLYRLLQHLGRIKDDLLLEPAAPLQEPV